MAQEVRQNRDISERRSKVEGGEPYFATRPMGHCATCQGPSYIKNKYSLLYQKFDAEYLFSYLTIFSKKAVFSEKTAKNCFGDAFDNFLEKEGVLRQKLTNFFLSEMRY